MRNRRSIVTIMIASAIALTTAIGISAQTSTTVPDGEKAKVIGIISARGADTFKMHTLDNSQSYSVVLTADTSIKTNRKGAFRAGRNYEAGYLLRGLRVEVQGAGNSAGDVIADTIRFNDADLRIAQSLQSRMTPVEDQVANNSERIATSEENQKRMSGQIEENQALTTQAQATADRANNRINGLDEFDLIKTITVPFATGSSTVNAEGKKIIDDAAAWVKTQNTNGWVIAVVGFADSSGNSTANRTLSEKRAGSVINYIVTQYDLPMHRFVQPFGAGVNKPVATNDTKAGRAQNRRVEIRLLQNKGISGM